MTCLELKEALQGYRHQTNKEKRDTKEDLTEAYFYGAKPCKASL